ncbi:protein kinase domain-containing protein [Ditylenchus destructor]|uniref:cyclin-dependent kinase n=1 Tax=Ditylenchus destructor TaxID=166010 RepID=A0AAD4NEQ4_9BILA|nr:protein kinase domain-containing protein [Ditylenchus destructor]
MDDDTEAPYFKAVPSSPEDEGELSDGNSVRKANAQNKRPKNTEDEEERLRQKLLEKCKQKEAEKTSRKQRHYSEDEEMFTIQPGGVPTDTKREGSLPSRSYDQKDKSRVGGSFKEESSKSKEKEQEKIEAKPVRKPIEWKLPKEREKVHVATRESAKKDTSARQESGSSSTHRGPSHDKYRSRSPPKRKYRDEDGGDDYRRSEKYSRRDTSDRYPHSSSRHRHDRDSHRRYSPQRTERSLSKTGNDRPSAEQKESKDTRPAEKVLKTKIEVKPEELVEDIRTSSSSSSSTQNSARNSPLSGRSNDAKEDDKNEMMETAMPETKEEENKKYSKFESSPENEDNSSDDEDRLGADGGFSDEDMMDANDIEPDQDINDLSAMERKDFNELTEEEKAMLSPETLQRMESQYQKKLISQLPVYFPGIWGCRNVAEFECLNRIEEGTFGVVYRAIEKKTDEIVALKRLKMEKEREGFPITSLREINMLLKCGKHPNVVNVREIVVGSNMDKIYLVMEYVEHDMKSLMETMKSKNKKFTTAQVKTLMKQLLSGIEYMHEEYVIHRDLKTSNLLMSHSGILKIGDFGLAREFGSPIKPYTPIVVTLWYRSPELLLGIKEYSTAVDMWSVGCIFAEFMKLKPLFQGRGEIDQLNKIFMEIGTPNEHIWPGYNELPGVRKFAFADVPFNQLRKQFASELPSDKGFDLFNRLLAPCPNRRISASKALKSPWFEEDPLPTPPDMFPTWPAKSEHNKKPVSATVTAPAVVKPSNEPKPSAEKLKLMTELGIKDMKTAHKDGFSLKFDAPKFK